VIDHGVPVELPGATVEAVAVNPRDFILADRDGAIVIPAAVVVQVLEQAEELAVREAEIRHGIASGLSLSEALAKFGHV
jgi:regulator of RNase E activity RraA